MSDSRHLDPAAVRLENAIPILRVEDLDASIVYYTDMLGFTLDWRVTRMASVSRNGHAIKMCERAQGHPGTWVWIGVTDAGRLYEEIAAKGATIRLAPTNFPWAYEMLVEDPDGHVLCFASGSREGEPFSEWPYL